MSSKTFIAREEKSMPGSAKDRLTLFLGANAEDDLELKPIISDHSRSPKATLFWVCAKSIQWCMILCDPLDSSLPVIPNSVLEIRFSTGVQRS